MLYEKELISILDKFRNHKNIASDEALDGDITTKLSKYLLLELDLIEGNITNAEYEKLNGRYFHENKK